MARGGNYPGRGQQPESLPGMWGSPERRPYLWGNTENCDQNVRRIPFIKVYYPARASQGDQHARGVARPGLQVRGEELVGHARPGARVAVLA